MCTADKHEQLIHTNILAVNFVVHTHVVARPFVRARPMR